MTGAHRAPGLAIGESPLAGPGSTPGRAPWGSAARPGNTVVLMATAAARMSEDELDRQVRGILRDLEVHGHRVLRFHPWSSRKSAAGWPDWAMVGPGGFMVRELKRESEKPRADQQEWLDWLAAAGVDAGVWRPSDLYSGRVARELAAIAGLGGFL